MVSVELEDIRMYVDAVSKWFEFCEEFKGFDKIVARNKIEEYNKGVDSETPVNGRRLTNIGVFRIYLMKYLQNHPRIHQDMIQMVRQLEPDANGLPLEVYAFTNDTNWMRYEGIQSDIFDHVLAVIKEFDLRVYQNPTGEDVKSIVLH